MFWEKIKWGQYALCLDGAENLNSFKQSLFWCCSWQSAFMYVWRTTKTVSLWKQSRIFDSEPTAWRMWSCSDEDLRVVIPGCSTWPSGCALVAKHPLPQFFWPQNKIWLVWRSQNDFDLSSWFGGADRAQDCLAGTSEQLKAHDLQT